MYLRSDVKRRDLIKLAKKLSRIYELELIEGRRHTKIRCVHNGKITVIPRYQVVNRFTADEIIKQLSKMGFTEKQIQDNF